MATVDELKGKLKNMSDQELSDLHKSDDRVTLREAIEAEQASRSQSQSSAPSQPWASPQEKPSEARDQQTPSGTNPSEEVTALNEDDGNGGGDEPDATADEDEDEPEQLNPDAETVQSSPDAVTSIERDQVTPSGMNPSEQARLDQERVGRGIVLGHEPPPEDIPSEVRDQVTPHGRDLSLALDDQTKPSLESSAYPTDDELLASRMAALPEEEQEEIREEISALASQAVDRRVRSMEAREMEARMVTGTKVYGNAARRPNHNKTLGGMNRIVDLNRRVRRQAQRALEAEKAKGKAKQ